VTGQTNRGRWQSSFHRESSAPHVSSLSNSGGRAAACKLRGRPMWILSTAEGILFADGEDMTVCGSWLLHSSHHRFATLRGRIFRTMAQNARLQGLGFTVLCILLNPVMTTAQEPAIEPPASSASAQSDGKPGSDSSFSWRSPATASRGWSAPATDSCGRVGLNHERSFPLCRLEGDGDPIDARVAARIGRRRAPAAARCWPVNATENTSPLPGFPSGLRARGRGRRFNAGS